MKKLIIQIIILCIGINITAQYNIELEVKGAENMNTQLAYYQGDKQFIVQDGKFNDKAKINFKGDKNLPYGIYFIIVGKDFCDILIRDEQNFKLISDTSDLVFSMKVKGSEENKIFFDYQKEVFKLKIQIDKLEKLFKKEDNDSATAAGYSSDLEKLTTELENVSQRLKKQHGKSYTAKILTAIDANVDEFDFADSELLLTPFYHNKIRMFIKRSIDKNYMYINQEIQKLLNSIRHEKYNYQYTATYLLNFYSTFYKIGINRVFLSLQIIIFCRIKLIG